MFCILCDVIMCMWVFAMDRGIRQRVMPLVLSGGDILLPLYVLYLVAFI